MKEPSVWLENEYRKLYKKQFSIEMNEDEEKFIKEFANTFFDKSKTLEITYESLYMLKRWYPKFFIKKYVSWKITKHFKESNLSENLYLLKNDISELLYCNILIFYLRQ